MNRTVCIHAHFYQPPRENPWLEEIELQDSAYPYHDWNERISSECYAPNAASRILGASRKIVEIVNNYSQISFNFGPTLLSWLQRNEPDVYASLIEADRQSRKLFSGHGAAIAQAYNHIIMPLANTRDKRTQVIWGVKDFESRFGRKPEGMWLPETAVDIETLEILAENGIAFTILSPHQAKRFRKIGEKEWVEIDGGRIDPKRPYLCRLPSGKSIALFFYDGPISHDIAFGNLLDNGEFFAKRLAGAFVNEARPQLVHIATDGETYGHHHRFGDMALSYCLDFIKNHKLAELTIYGEFIKKNPPSQEVEINENTSWSCCHGVERWRSNCGCQSGAHPDWQQAWRSPLRSAMDWLRDGLIRIYEEHASEYFKEPWAARDGYIDVVLDRSAESINRFISSYASRKLGHDEVVKALKLLEMQRHAMYMYTSCGWFFDDVSNMESAQVMKCACRAMQLARDVSGIDLEPAYEKVLERAPSNMPEFENGARYYELFIKPSMLDLLRVGAHYAVSSMFEDYPDTASIYCYTAQRQYRDEINLGKQRLLVGRTSLHSNILLEGGDVAYAVLHLGDHNMLGGVRFFIDDEAFKGMHTEMIDTFSKGDFSLVMQMMDKHFGSHNYSLWHLFKDEQRKVLAQVLGAATREVETSFRQIYEHNYPIIQIMHDMKHPLPRALATTVEFIVNTDLHMAFAEKQIDFDRLQKLSDEIRRWSIKIDSAALGFEASGRLNEYSDKLLHNPYDAWTMETINRMLGMLKGIRLPLNLWKAQNVHFNIGRQIFSDMAHKAESGDIAAAKWVEDYSTLGKFLQIGSS